MPSSNDKKIEKLLNFADDAGLAMYDELTDLNDNLDTLAASFNGVDLSNVQYIAGEKGEKGDPGRDGKDGKIGPIGPEGKQGKAGFDGYDGIDGKPGADGKDGRDGKDGSPDTAEVIKSKLEQLEGDARLDASAIKNLPKMVGKLAKDGYPYGLPQPAGAMTYKLNGAQVGRGNILNITGSGITATPLDDGITYNITGGGGGGGITSINGNSNAAQTIAAGAGISVVSGGGTTTITNTALGTISPITIENGNSLFSTGLTGVWTSGATLSIIFGENAGLNADAVNSYTALGELAGASDGSENYLPHFANFIGNRSGFNAFRAIHTTALGSLAGAYASDASYSFFAGAQAGISAQYAGNSFFFGQTAGHNATNAAYTILMGINAGYDAANAAHSNFLGAFSGSNAINANNATFIGASSGFSDTVDNRGTITYTGSSGIFLPSYQITAAGGGTATVLSDNGAGTLRIANSRGTFTGLITQATTGRTATISTYTPSTSSVLIGDFTSTGGGNNSVAIGANASNAGFDNSIVIGVGALNTMNNQYAWGDDIINWRFAGDNYILPTVSPSGFGGQFLGVGAGNQLSWEVPGAAGNSLTVLAATAAVLPFAPNYANGAAGVGATLTATANGVLVVDGVTIPLNGRVLVKDQAATLQNGIYQLSTVGTGGIPYVLTRTTDADNPSDFNDQVVIPAQGTQSATPFAEQNFVVTIGTDPIVYAPQSSLFVRQQAAGTQVANQIPVYTGTALTITKGTGQFTFDPANSNFAIKNPALESLFSINGAAKFIRLGDTAGTSNGCTIEIEGTGGPTGITAVIPDNGLFRVIDFTLNDKFLEIDVNAKTFGIGDLDGRFNGTSVKISDTTELIQFNGTRFNFNALQDFANNAAAITGGLLAGDFYYTSSGGDGLVKVVI